MATTPSPRNPACSLNLQVLRETLNPLPMMGFDPNALKLENETDLISASPPCQGFSRVVDPFAGVGRFTVAAGIRGRGFYIH
jgi:hypothetical protein